MSVFYIFKSIATCQENTLTNLAIENFRYSTQPHFFSMPPVGDPGIDRRGGGGRRFLQKIIHTTAGSRGDRGHAPPEYFEI